MVRFPPVTVNIPYLVFALLLLWFPRQWLRLGGRVAGSGRHPPRPKFTNPRDEREPGDRGVRLREELVKTRNYIDLFRAGGGAWCLMNFCFALEPAGEGRSLEIVLKAVALGLAVLIQTIRWEERIALFAPIFFVTGMAAGVVRYDVALFAAVLAWAVNPILPNPAAFLLAFAALLFGFGTVFFSHTDSHVLLAVVLVALPVLCSFVARRPLSQFTKRPRPAGDAAVP